MKFEVQGSSDKKQYFSIKFSLPLSITNPISNIAYSIRKWKYKMFPDHCDCCGAKMYVRSYMLSHVYSNGTSLSIENTASDRHSHGRYFVCRDCIIRELETKEWTPRFTRIHGADGVINRFWRSDTCAISGKYVHSYKDVEIDPFIDMLFCTRAWNSDYISKAAVVECAKQGNVNTSVWGIHKGKMAMRNHKMLYVDDQGNLL
jgi:hypothetical protein